MSNHSIDVLRPTQPKLAQLSGMAQARAWGLSLARDLHDYHAKKIAWTDMDRGCVVHGPPGTGKTTFAKALAATTGLPLIVTSYADWQATNDGNLGDVHSAIDTVFAKAREIAPCIVFIDELDSLPSRGRNAQHTEWYTTIVNALLAILDGARPRDGVIVIGACNDPSKLDPALVRPGRLDRQIAINKPRLRDLPDILRFHLRADAAGMKDLSRIAILCNGMSGADIEQIVRDARRRARHAAQKLDADHFLAAIETLSGLTHPDIKRRVAIHEAGHAVATYRLELSQDINVSLYGKEVRFIQLTNHLTASLVMDYLTCYLAGRAGEDVFFSEPSNYAGGTNDSDLATATGLAYRAAAQLGLMPNIGLCWHENRNIDQHLLARSAVGETIRQMLDKAYEKACQLLEREREFHLRVAQALLDRAALSMADLTALDPTPPPPRVPILTTKPKSEIPGGAPSRANDSPSLPGIHC